VAVLGEEIEERLADVRGGHGKGVSREWAKAGIKGRRKWKLRWESCLKSPTQGEGEVAGPSPEKFMLAKCVFAMARHLYRGTAVRGAGIRAGSRPRWAYQAWSSIITQGWRPAAAPDRREPKRSLVGRERGPKSATRPANVATVRFLDRVSPC
jgi:hypothetical protein